MPSAQPLPPIDAQASQTVPPQVQTITLDFGIGSYVPEGVTLINAPVAPQVQLELVFGDDPDPNSRITVGPQIGTAPLPCGSGRTNLAILFQVGNVPVGTQYKILAACSLTNGDVATMDVILPVRDPTAP